MSKRKIEKTECEAWLLEEIAGLLEGDEGKFKEELLGCISGTPTEEAIEEAGFDINEVVDSTILKLIKILKSTTPDALETI